jgi:arylsulfatase A-like enzyme
VILSIDRLGAGWLGPYGNTWLDTPNFNRLAAESLLIETAISDSPELDAVCRSLWTGLHAAAPQRDAVSLAAAARKSGTARLVTDEPRLIAHPMAGQFSEQRLLETTRLTELATQIEETELFRFFASAREELEQFVGPGLLHLHSRGMSAAWDAPLALRYQFADELDPDPPAFVEPPEQMLPEQHDPDELLGIVQAYAGQVALLDMCLGPWLDALEEHPLADQTLLVVTSPRGYPLGEHRRVGPCDQALYGELLHVPLLVYIPGEEPARLQRIVQPHQLHSLVQEVCGWLPAPSSPGGPRLVEVVSGAMGGAAYASHASQRAIRTPAWFMRESNHGAEASYELFAKPDDRWEANEISSRCGQVVEMLAAELQRFSAFVATGQTAGEVPLPAELCDIWR